MTLFAFDGSDTCDWRIVFLGFELFVWKPPVCEPWWHALLHPASKQFGLGRSYGDGLLALATPWFLLYLER